jgi:hypothetical protein
MTKSADRGGRKQASPIPAPAAAATAAANTPARIAPDTRPLLDRILDTPDLALAIPRLQPDLLHKVIQSCGLEDCSELVALATPQQLAGVFDRDLWRAARSGGDEQFDPDRFGVWLEVLAESGAASAAQRIARMDPRLVVAGLAHHIRVFDHASVAGYTTMDGTEVPGKRFADDRVMADVGGYSIVARRTASWDAILEVLVALDAEHHNSFHRLMRGCRELSNSAPEVDGLDDLLADPDQAAFDLAFARERRRDRQGYMTPAQARAFLQNAREVRLEARRPPPDDAVARAYFSAVRDDSTDERSNDDSPEESDSDNLGATPASDDPVQTDPGSNAFATVIDLLTAEGVVPPAPRALLQGARDERPRFAGMQRFMQGAHDRDRAAYLLRSEELAFLVNVMLSGCAIQGRAPTPQEASDAAVAVCNLGLENWPAHFPVANDLIRVFQVGWAVLHREVCMYVAARLIEVLAAVRCADRDTQQGLVALRREMKKHVKDGAPWRAKDALEVIAILDTPAWAALVGLTGECPVLHAAVGAALSRSTQAIGADAYEFISENGQIASVRAFMASLADLLV